MDRIRLLLFVVLICGHAATATAATVRQWVMGVAQAAETSGVVPPGSDARKRLDAAIVTLTDAGVMEEELADFVTKYTRPDLVAIARRSQARFAGDITASVQSVKQVFQLVPGNDPALTTIVLELEGAETESSMKWDAEVLRRLERKYGPGSAKLNAVEAVFAYGLQGVKGFGLDSRTGYPGPFEFIAAYSAAYLTKAEDKASLLSAAEVGLRHYFFQKSWGSGSGRLAFLKPAFMSFGMAVAGESNDPLTSPFQGKSRYGAFFGWGDMKVAYLFTGTDKKFLFTQQVQIIPWVF